MDDRNLHRICLEQINLPNYDNQSPESNVRKSGTLLDLKIKHPLDEKEEVLNLTKFLEEKKLSLDMFAVKKPKVNPKIQYDPWGNAYKPSNLPASKNAKNAKAAQKIKQKI